LGKRPFIRKNNTCLEKALSLFVYGVQSEKGNWDCSSCFATMRQNQELKRETDPKV
jgi:hypothetical protein